MKLPGKPNAFSWKGECCSSIGTCPAWEMIVCTSTSTVNAITALGCRQGHRRGSGRPETHYLLSWGSSHMILGMLRYGCRMTEPLWVLRSHLIQLLTQSRANFGIKAGHSGLCPIGFWKPPRIRIPQPLWATSSSFCNGFFFPNTQSYLSLVQLLSAFYNRVVLDSFIISVENHTLSP